MWHLVNFIFNQGHSIYWKFGNIHFLTNFDNISDIIHSRVIVIGQNVVCGETFQMMWHWVTLTFGEGHSIYWKFGKYSFLTKSQTLFTVDYETLPTFSLCGDLQIYVTLCDLDEKSRSHSLLASNLEKIHLWPFLTISQTLFIESIVMELGQKVACGETFKMMWH